MQLSAIVMEQCVGFAKRLLVETDPFGSAIAVCLALSQDSFP